MLLGAAILVMLPFSAQSGPIRQTAGVVTGLYAPCWGGGPHILHFDFHGRMPVGNANFNIVEGAGAGYWPCDGTTIPLHMTGKSPAGTQYFWYCPVTMRRVLPAAAPVPVDTTTLHPGLTWRVAGPCTGAATFRLNMTITTVVQTLSQYGREIYQIAGLYLTNR